MAGSPSGRRKSMDNMEMIKMTPDAKAKQAEGKFKRLCFECRSSINLFDLTGRLRLTWGGCKNTRIEPMLIAIQFSFTQGWNRYSILTCNSTVLLCLENVIICLWLFFKCHLPVLKNCDCAILQNLCPSFVNFSWLLWHEFVKMSLS